MALHCIALHRSALHVFIALHRIALLAWRRIHCLQGIALHGVALHGIALLYLRCSIALLALYCVALVLHWQQHCRALQGPAVALQGPAAAL